MAPQYAQLLNYIIGLLLLGGCALMLKRKARTNPHARIAGMSIGLAMQIAYVGIGIFGMMVLLTLFGI